MEQVEEIRNEMLESFTSSILPTVFEEVIRNALVSELLPILKKEIVEVTTTVINQMKSEVTNDVHWRQFSTLDVEKFLTENAEILNKHEAQRDNALHKAKRLEYLLRLNEEQITSNPPYVPKKFRKDRYHVKSERELDILRNRELNDMKSEMEIWELRMIENKRRVQLQDDLVAIFLNERIQNPYIKEEVIKTWNKNNRKEEERIEKVWTRKIREMKASFEKDKEYIQNHNKTRYKQQNLNIPTIINNNTQNNIQQQQPQSLIRQDHQPQLLSY